MRSRGAGGLLLPAVIVSVGLVAVPALLSFAISFFDYNPLIGEPRFIGLGNYQELVADPRLLKAAAVTAQIAVPALLIELSIGLAIALAVHQLKGLKRGLIISLLLAPMLLPGAAAALSFALLLTPQYGPIDVALTALGVRVDWLTDVGTAPWTIVFVEVWAKTGFVMLFAIAVLATIPDDLYEAGKLDGAGPVSLFRFITLPHIVPTLLAVIVIRLVDLAKMFDLPFMLTAGGPGNATEPLSMFIMRTGFESLRVGYAAAQSVVFVIGFLVGLVALVVLGRLPRIATRLIGR